MCSDRRPIVKVDCLTSKTAGVVSVRHVETLVACAGVAEHAPQAPRRVLQPNAAVAGAAAAAHAAALQHTRGN